MRLRFGGETLLLIVGVVGLLEQEVVRVTLEVEPSLVISGICFAFVLIGAGVATARNFKIGPVEVQVKEQPSPPPTQDDPGEVSP